MKGTAQAVSRILALGAGAALLAGPAFGACSGGVAVVSSPTITASPSFDPFAALDRRTSGTISIQNSLGTDCTDVRLTFADTTTPGDITSGTDSIPFKITTTGGTTQLVNDVNGILVGTIAANATATVNVDFLIEALSGVTAPAPGTPYQDNDIQLVVTSAVATPTTLDNAHSLTVQADVDTLLDVNINETGYLGSGTMDAYTMDLGAMTTGTTGSVGLQVRANVAHGVTITSANAGAMTGPVPGTIDTSSVPYTLSLDGQPVTLGSPMAVAGATQLGGEAKTLAVTVGDTSTVPAGSYRDTLTITVDPGV